MSDVDEKAGGSGAAGGVPAEYSAGWASSTSSARLMMGEGDSVKLVVRLDVDHLSHLRQRLLLATVLRVLSLEQMRVENLPADEVKTELEARERVARFRAMRLTPDTSALK